MEADNDRASDVRAWLSANEPSASCNELDRQRGHVATLGKSRRHGPSTPLDAAAMAAADAAIAAATIAVAAAEAAVSPPAMRRGGASAQRGGPSHEQSRSPTTQRRLVSMSELSSQPSTAPCAAAAAFGAAAGFAAVDGAPTFEQGLERILARQSRWAEEKD